MPTVTYACSNTGKMKTKTFPYNAVGKAAEFAKKLWEVRKWITQLWKRKWDQAIKNKKMKHQGYNARLDESLGMKHNPNSIHERQKNGGENKVQWLSKGRTKKRALG